MSSEELLTNYKHRTATLSTNLPEYEWSVRTDLDAADVVGVRLPLLHLLHGVVVVHSQLHVICPCNDPLIASNELSTSHGHFTHLKALNERLRQK